MNRILFFLIFLLCTNYSFAQNNLSIENIYLGETNSENPQDSVITFPTFEGGKIAEEINNFLLEYLNESIYDYQATSIAQALDSLQYSREKNRSGLTEVSYKVFHSRNIISLSLRKVGYGASVSFMTDYLTFSSITGNQLTIDSLIAEKHKTRFKHLMKIKKNAYLKNYKYRLQELVVSTRIDSSSYKIHYNRAQNCYNNPFDYSRFKFKEGYIELITPCSNRGGALPPFKNIELRKYILEPLLAKQYN